MSDEQKKKAIIADKAPADILTKADTQAKPQDDKGISHRELNQEQRAALKRCRRAAGACLNVPREATFTELMVSRILALHMIPAGAADYYPRGHSGTGTCTIRFPVSLLT